MSIRTGLYTQSDFYLKECNNCITVENKNIKLFNKNTAESKKKTIPHLPRKVYFHIMVEKNVKTFLFHSCTTTWLTKSGVYF